MDKCASKSCGCSGAPVAATSTISQPQRTAYRIDNMDCPTDEALIRDRLAGIDKLDFNLVQRTLAVDHTLPTLDPLKAALVSIGMQVWQTNVGSTWITEKSDISEVTP